MLCISTVRRMNFSSKILPLPGCIAPFVVLILVTTFLFNFDTIVSLLRTSLVVL